VIADWVTWTGAIAWYVCQVSRTRPVPVSSRAVLANWTVVLLSPSLFNPWLEPYHAIPLVLSTILLVLFALGADASALNRKLPLFALLALASTSFRDSRLIDPLAFLDCDRDAWPSAPQPQPFPSLAEPLNDPGLSHCGDRR
jgi:hypothetical protein